MPFVSFNLRTAQAVPAVQALVAGAVADGDVAADVAEGSVAHHVRELLVKGARGGDGCCRDLIPGQRLALAVPVAIIVTVSVAIAVRLHRCGGRSRRTRLRLRG